MLALPMLAYGMPLGLGPAELMIILVILVLLFGATRLADIGSGLGKGIKEFRKSVKDEDEGEAEAQSAHPANSAAPAQSASAASNGQETVPAVKCSACGALNPVGAKHCNQCGAAIAAPVS